MYLLLSSQLKSSSASVVFDFSASLNDVAPMSPILFTVYMKRKGEEWIVDGCLLCVFFLLSSQLRLSFVSVVFDFNDSLNDIAPNSSMLLTVVVKRKGKCELLMDIFCLSFFLFVFTTQVEFCDCCV